MDMTQLKFPTVQAVRHANPPRPPRREPNCERRPREFLTLTEIDQLANAAHARSRYPARDEAMIRLIHRHHLRVSALTRLRWDQVDVAHGYFTLTRTGHRSTYSLSDAEHRLLTAVRHEMPPVSSAAMVFMSERNGKPVCPAGFGKTLSRLGRAAGLRFPIHPEMLRHPCPCRRGDRGCDGTYTDHD